MSYTAPPHFEEGDYPTAANLNIMSDDIEFLHDVIGDFSYELPTRYQYGTDQHFWFFSMYRYLIYDSTGVIHDPFGIEEDITISDPASGNGVLDLEGTDWVVPGRQYEVVGCNWCQESPTNDTDL